MTNRQTDRQTYVCKNSFNLVSENTGAGSTVRGRGVVGWRVGGVGLGACLLGGGMLALPSAHHRGVVTQASAVLVLSWPVRI